MPFVKPSNVKNTLSDLTEEPEKESAALTYTEAMQQAVAAMQVDPGKRNVLIAHQNVTNSGVNRRSDSETISIRGLDNIDRTVLDILCGTWTSPFSTADRKAGDSVLWHTGYLFYVGS